MTDALAEEPLDRELRICDPHHHLWDYQESVYLVDELRADTDDFNVVSTVFVECGSAYHTAGPDELRAVGETAWVRAQAPDDGLVAAIIGFADLRLGALVEPVLAAHIAAGEGRFRGIRHASAWDADPRIRPGHTNPPPGLLRDPAFGDGVAALGRAGLSFEAWLYFPQLAEFVALARAHPDVPMVLDHLGGPIGIGPYAEGARDDALAAWRAALVDVAACPNVALKLGGIGMPIFGMDWHRRTNPVGSAEVAAAWGDDIRRCIELFGVDRCMFESNFPVDRRSFSYRVCWNAFLRMTEGFSLDDRAALFHDTASRVYRLNL